MRTLYSMAFLATLATGNAYANCTSPTAPQDIPRGKTATLEQMVAAQKAVKDFDAATNEYTACLQAESDAEVAKLEQQEADPKKKEEQRKKVMSSFAKQQDVAIEADKVLAERFNEQLRIFKAKDAAK